MHPGAHGAPRILVVEDNYLVAEELADFVRKQGYAVGAAVGSLEQSLAQVASGSFEGAIIDVNLGGRPSFPVCHALQSKGIPFLFLTGYSTMAVPPEFGAAPYLLKPVVESQLAAALDGVIETRLAGLTFGNVILDTLQRRSLRSLAASLDSVELQSGDRLARADEPVSHVHFPIDSVVSIVTPAASRPVELLSVGREGMTAPGVLLGISTAMGDTIVQVGGGAWRLPAEVLRQVADGDAGLRRHMLRQVGETLRQAMDSIWFAGHAPIRERLARWLVQTSDRIRSRTVTIKHESLADILGVRRASVTEALHELEDMRLIRSMRNTITVRDRSALRSIASRSTKGLRHQAPTDAE
jgi:CheY-like chemotaxis protein